MISARLNMAQPISELEKELCIFTIAISLTVGVISILWYSRRRLQQFEQGHLDAGLCCECLNEVIPIKTFLHFFLTVMFCMYNHPYLFFLNLHMVMWLMRNLSKGFDRNKIANPGQASAYIRQMKYHLIFFLACFAIYAYYEIKYVFDQLAAVNVVNVIYLVEKPSVMEGQDQYPGGFGGQKPDL